MGLLSNVLASYLTPNILGKSFLYVPVSIWLILASLAFTTIASYLLILTPEVKQAAIYTNVMVNRNNRCVHYSEFAPLAIQYAEKLWKALEKDKPSLAKQVLENLHNSGSDALSLDLIEYLIFLILSGFDLFWASGKLKSYGYPTFPSHLGDIPRYQPSTIYTTKEIKEEPEEEQFEYKNLVPVVEENRFIQHFLGKTSLDRIYTPGNWLLFTPKGTRISVNRTGHKRIIKLSNCYSTISIDITKSSVGTGLPYGIRIKEKSYDEKRFFTTDFRIDHKATFSRLLSIHPKIDDHHNWANLVFRKLVANFSLPRKGIIEEIEL